MRKPLVLQRLFRVGSGLLLCGAMLAVLGGGSCDWCSGGNCDDDDCFDDDDENDAGCDDDDFEEAQVGPGAEALASDPAAVLRQIGALPARRLADATPWGPWPADPGLIASLGDEAYRLVDFTVEPSADPFRHPVARVTVESLSILEAWGLAAYTGRDFTAFASRVLAVNDELLGLPPWAGRLRPSGFHFLDTLVAVVFEQLPPWAGDDGEPLQDARVVVIFDHLGRLLQIENETLAPPGSGTPTPEAWAIR